MKAGEKFIIKSGAKDEKNRMFINFPAFNKWREEQRQKEKIEKLYKQVELWKKAEEIRAFASSFTKNAIKNRKKLKSAREVRKYVEFVKEYANSIDPLSDYFKDIP